MIKMCVFDYKKGGAGVSPAHLRGCVCLLSGAKGQQPVSALLHLSVQEVECRGCLDQPQGDFLADAEFDAEGTYSRLVVLERTALPLPLGTFCGCVIRTVIPCAVPGLRFGCLFCGDGRCPPSGENEPHRDHGPPLLDRLPFILEGC